MSKNVNNFHDDEWFWTTLAETFPDARCELNYQNVYELSISVILSAQTTDRSVNLVTPLLFATYPTINDLAMADYDDVVRIIKKIGLYKTKTKNIITFAQTVLSDFDGIIPKTIDELITLPGVGRKTANVIISEGYGLPGIAIDTHVERVVKRLGIVNMSANTLQIEEHLKSILPKEKWHLAHHQLLFMGRYLCLARKPNCHKCPFIKTHCQMIHHDKK